MTTNEDPIEIIPLPSLFKESLKGQLRFWRNMNRDYASCLKDKEVADRTCKTWEETVDRAMEIAALYGATIRTAQELAPDLLDDAERAVFS